MDIKLNKGITLVSLVITVIILLIISGISITGAIRGIEQSQENIQFSELNIVQHAILERYTKAQLTKEILPGEPIKDLELNSIIEEIKNKTGESITLKGGEYLQLNKMDLENLGITEENDEFIVNYSTGEVINKTQKVTLSGKILYICL